MLAINVISMPESECTWSYVSGNTKILFTKVRYGREVEVMFDMGNSGTSIKHRRDLDYDCNRKGIPLV